MHTTGGIGRNSETSGFSIAEFLVERETEQITHLVLREGCLWVQKDVLIPVSEIERIDEGRVHLKLSREEVANLPTIPIWRWREGLAGA